MSPEIWWIILIVFLWILAGALVLLGIVGTVLPGLAGSPFVFLGLLNSGGIGRSFTSRPGPCSSAGHGDLPPIVVPLVMLVPVFTGGINSGEKTPFPNLFWFKLRTVQVGPQYDC